MRTWPSVRSASIARFASPARRGHGREAQLVGRPVAVLVLPERGELTEQALGGIDIRRVRPAR